MSDAPRSDGLNPFQSPSGTQPGVEIHPEVVSKSASNWPTVLGVIGIALGIFGSMGSVAGIATNGMMLAGKNFFADLTLNDPQTAASFEMMRKFAGINMVLCVVSLIAALWLLVAGIMILQRRSGCRWVASSWAMFKTMVVLFATGLQFYTQQETMSLFQNNANPQLEFLGPMIWVFSIIGALFGLAWGLALPGFVLIWFSRAKIKAQMASW